MSTNPADKPAGVDLEEVSRLVTALERDLEKVRAGSEDLDTLRTEVTQLRAALESPVPIRSEVDEGSHVSGHHYGKGFAPLVRNRPSNRTGPLRSRI